MASVDSTLEVASLVEVISETGELIVDSVLVAEVVSGISEVNNVLMSVLMDSTVELLLDSEAVLVISVVEVLTSVLVMPVIDSVLLDSTIEDMLDVDVTPTSVLDEVESVLVVSIVELVVDEV